MTDKKFIDFMTSEENSKEVENIFSDFKKHFYDVKPGYDHGLLLTNTENGKTWIDSGSIFWKDFYITNKKEFIDTVIPFNLSVNKLAKLKLSITDLNRFRTYERLVDVNKKDV